MKSKKLLLIVLMAAVLISAVACAQQAEPQESEATSGDGENATAESGGIVTVEITMAGGGVITLELDGSAAPETVKNFVELAESDYYDGLTFHRIVPGFVIQGGDPDGTGTGGPGYGITGEFASNGFQNPISHEKGVISMARSNDPDSAGSQFFIVLDDSAAASLDGEYAAFGKVTSGIEVVDEIAAVETNGETPMEPVVMESVKVVE